MVGFDFYSTIIVKYSHAHNFFITLALKVRLPHGHLKRWFLRMIALGKGIEFKLFYFAE